MAEWVHVKTKWDLGDITEADRHDHEERTFVPVQLTSHFQNENRHLVIVLKQVAAGPKAHTVQVGNGENLRTFNYNAVTVQFQGEDGLSSADLRDVPLVQLVETSLNIGVVAPTEGADALSKGTATKPAPVPDVPDHVREAWPKGDRALVFEWVNRVYVAALANGVPPTKAVAEKFKVNAGTGSRLTTYARKAGVLTASSVNTPRKKRNHDQNNEKDQSSP